MVGERRHESGGAGAGAPTSWGGVGGWPDGRRRPAWLAAVRTRMASVGTCEEQSGEPARALETAAGGRIVALEQQIEAVNLDAAVCRDA